MKITRLSTPTPLHLSPLAELETWFRQPFQGFPALGSFLGSLQETFPSTTSGRLPANLHEETSEYLAQFEVPGVSKEDLHVELDHQVLTVKALRKQKTAQGERATTLTRSISVPESVRAEGITAKLENGILTLTLPKIDEPKPKLIPIS